MSRNKSSFIGFVVTAFLCAVIFGCGGSGGSSGTNTTGTNTTGTNTTGTNTTGTNTTGTGTTGTPTVTITPSKNPPEVWEADYSMGTSSTLTLNVKYTGPGKVANYFWDVESGNGFLTNGYLNDTSGNPFPEDQLTTLTEAVYQAQPDFLYPGYEDYVSVTAYNSSKVALATGKILIPLAYSGVLPPAIGTGGFNITLDRTVYTPGSTVTATMVVSPGFDNLGFTLTGPPQEYTQALTFTPQNVTINGKPITLPYSESYKDTTPPFTDIVKFTIPANTPNEFPTTSPRDNEEPVVCGTWFAGSGGAVGGGFVFDYPYVIQSAPGKVPAAGIRPIRLR